MQKDNFLTKMACKQAFDCGIDDIKGNAYEYELTDSFFTLIVQLRVECKMNLPYLDDKFQDTVANRAWVLAEEVGGICSCYEVVEAIGELKENGRKVVDRRSKQFKMLHNIGYCLDTFRNMGCLYACNDDEAIERDYAGVRKAMDYY